LQNRNSALAAQLFGMLVSALIVVADAAPLFAEDAGTSTSSPAEVATLLVKPPVVAPKNLYSEASVGHLSPVAAGALQRVYVPNVLSSDVDIIDPATLQVIDHFRVPGSPQHIVPSWDLKTLWIASSRHQHRRGSLTPIDPMIGMPGKTIPVSDAYNMYFTPDGKFAIVVAEAMERLEFRDPHTMLLKSTLAVPRCRGLNHADFSADSQYAIFTASSEAVWSKSIWPSQRSSAT
jgi:YVTN family beta-propeller protein